MVITAGFAAQGEKIKRGVVIPSKKTIENWADIPGCDYSVTDKKQKEMFVNALVDYLQNPWGDSQRNDIAGEASEKYNIETITDAWNEQLRALK